jgi:hypothetical protein
MGHGTYNINNKPLGAVIYNSSGQPLTQLTQRVMKNTIKLKENEEDTYYYTISSTCW